MTIVGALPFTLQNGTTADATQVMADFNSIKTDVNANAAQNGANNDITSLAGLTTPLSVAQGGSGSATPGPFVFAGGYRNIARRNGGLEIWQRGAGGAASFAVAASTPAYTADGWYFTNGANQACIVSQQAGISDGSQWCAKIIRNSGQTGTGALLFDFLLDTDEIYPFLGQFVRFSYVAKAGADFSPTSGAFFGQIVVGTGTPTKVVSFTGSSVVATVSENLTTSAARYQGSTALVIPTNTRQVAIRFTWSPVGTASTDDSVYIDDVQLEIVPAATGYTASNFERLNFEEALLLCQRHFAKTFAYSTAPAQNVGISTGEILAVSPESGNSKPLTFTGWRFPVPMRVAPTVTLYNPAATNAQARDETQSADCTSTATRGITVNNVAVTALAATGNQIHDISGVHLSADAGI